MLVFACETSCDETSICLMEDNKILKHVIFSQEIHRKYGGVVPELASRAHLEKLQEITMGLFKKSNVDPSKIDIFCATCGPGLIGSLLIGSTFTKSLSIGYNKPFIPINHLEGHILSTSFNNSISYPHLVLLVTGGHTQIYLMKNTSNIKLLGESVDDALGEAFDKTAKLLGFNYPGGASIEKMALEGDENSFEIPKPFFNEKNFNFSFSGIKTHINLLVKKYGLNKKFIRDICASFQKTITKIIIKKLTTGIKILDDQGIKIKSISCVGGVANNMYLKKNLEKIFYKENIQVYYPVKEMMSDNAAMIAWACKINYDHESNNILFKPDPRLKIKELI